MAKRKGTAVTFGETCAIAVVGLYTLAIIVALVVCIRGLFDK
jgi:hypothetical protein